MAALALASAALSGCAGGRRFAYGPGRTDYPEPGPPGDPWAPYIDDAARRFQVPQLWIRAVMERESGGREYRHGRPLTSAAGAMGLMQLMPATYADMQAQNGLGDDPYEPHDNILAGSAYIRLMYNRYGAPGFLAAYNAGPQRLDDYVNTGRALPNETVDYVAAVAPALAPALPPSLAPATAPVAPASPIRLAAYAPPPAASPVSSQPLPAYGAWAIQVGAYASQAEAHFADTMAREAAYAQLSASQAMVEPTSRFAGQVVYRARLAGLARAGAGAACDIVRAHGIPCMIVAPGG